MKDITLITASYNTPIITKRMILSFKRYHPDASILVCENSSDDETKTYLKRKKNRYIVNDNKNHAPSVDALIEEIKTEHALLVDTDVIFLNSINKVYEQFKKENYTAIGHICTDSAGVYEPRIHPCFMMFSVSAVKKNNIKYYDRDRSDNKLPTYGDKNYDVGSSFFEDIKQNKFKIGNFNGEGFYYKHYGAMSWAIQKFNPALQLVQDIETGEHRHYHVYLNEQAKAIQYEEETSFLDVLD